MSFTTWLLLLLVAAVSSASGPRAADETVLDFDDLTDQVEDSVDINDFETDRTLADDLDRVGFYEAPYGAPPNTSLNRYWPGVLIPVRRGIGLLDSTASEIVRAMTFLSKHTCLSWTYDLPSSGQFISFEGKFGFPFCSSDGIGIRFDNEMRPAGKTIVNLHEWCLNPKNQNVRRNVMHYILHALGFAHTNTRPDRDEYITDVKEPRGAYEGNWGRCTWCDTHDMPYECHSVMHQDPGIPPAFKAKDPNTCKFPYEYTGTYKYPEYFMTANDMDSINKAYCQGSRNFYIINWFNTTFNGGRTCKNRGVDINSECTRPEWIQSCLTNTWFNLMKLICPETCFNHALAVTKEACDKLKPNEEIGDSKAICAFVNSCN